MGEYVTDESGVQLKQRDISQNKEVIPRNLVEDTGSAQPK